MRIWLIHAGDPLSIDAVSERPLRLPLLAGALAKAGHDVVWWTSTFDHTHKVQRYSRDTDLQLAPNLRLRLLHAIPYRRNISLRRLINHRQLARRFEKVAAGLDAPDIVFCTVPTVEFLAAAGRFATGRGIRLVADVQDQHPRIYEQLLPRVLRPVARLALTPLYRDLKSGLRDCTGIVSISPSFLAWALINAGRAATAEDRVFPLAFPRIEASGSDLAAARTYLAHKGVDFAKHLVWYVGTFNRWIDLGTPIAAARELAGKGVGDLQFVFSGNGDYEQRWRAEAADCRNVVFTGWIDMPKIALLQEQAWAGLAPYRSGFNTVGNKLFEYMCGGLPVLLSSEGDAAQLVSRHECGISYPAGDSGRLAKAIETLRGDPALRARMSRNALAAYEGEYEANQVYGAMVDYLVDHARKKWPPSRHGSLT